MGSESNIPAYNLSEQIHREAASLSDDELEQYIILISSSMQEAHQDRALTPHQSDLPKRSSAQP